MWWPGTATHSIRHLSRSPFPTRISTRKESRRPALSAPLNVPPRRDAGPRDMGREWRRQGLGGQCTITPFRPRRSSSAGNEHCTPDTTLMTFPATLTTRFKLAVLALAMRVLECLATGSRLPLAGQFEKNELHVAADIDFYLPCIPTLAKYRNISHVTAWQDIIEVEVLDPR